MFPVCRHVSGLGTRGEKAVRQFRECAQGTWGAALPELGVNWNLQKLNVHVFQTERVPG